MPKPRLLDLFCAAGGAARGYDLAGFDVVGVDLNHFKRYPYPQITTDALKLDVRFLRTFDAIHASPPCQGYTEMRAPGQKGAPRLIPQVRKLLKAAGVPYIIENVENARWAMEDPICLCGSMFGLEAEGHQLQRHRLFECSFDVKPPRPCQHRQPVIGVYGGHARNRSVVHGGRGTKDTWLTGHKGAASTALGIDWMTLAEMSESIPPAYTAYLGVHLRYRIGT